MSGSPTTLQIIATALFVLALVHTFSTGYFEQLAHRHPRHAGLWHLLGEVEIVFGLWALVLAVALFALQGTAAMTDYLDSRNYTEPLFVFAIMVVAGSRPILAAARGLSLALARLLPLPPAAALYFTALFLIPLLGSLITEPAAMTLAALLLRDRFFRPGVSTRFLYATVGVLFVNVSIGGTLTPYAAPPVLMVAGAWGWDLAYMLKEFGLRAGLAVAVNALVLTLLFRAELARLTPDAKDGTDGGGSDAVPWPVILLHLLLLAGVVVFAHHPPVFLGLLLLFFGVVSAYPAYQDRLMLKEALLVACFLAGLVILGGLQQWWLQPLLLRMDATSVYFGATALTAVTDNAALTYLASLVDGLSPEFKYAVVAGAVSGGGLTVIANAPNPAGLSILKGSFPESAVHPLGLFLAALPPTLVAMAAFLLV